MMVWCGIINCFELQVKFIWHMVKHVRCERCKMLDSCNQFVNENLCVYANICQKSGSVKLNIGNG